MGAGLDTQSNSSDVAIKGEYFLDGIPKEHCIPRVHKISPKEFMEKYYKPGKPVILTGMMDDWPAMTKWDTEYLKKQIGAKTHTFHYGKKTMQMKISDYIDTAVAYCKAQSSSEEENKDEKSEINQFPKLPSDTETLPYVRHFGPLNSASPELLADLKPETPFEHPEEFAFRNFLFVGVPKTKTETHYDASDNFVAITIGQKHISLLPPKGEQELNISDKDKISLMNFDAVPMQDPENLVLDLSQRDKPGAVMMHEHPAYSTAKSLVYSPLMKGEMVFIPQYWYHYIHNVDFSVSLTIQTTPK